MRLLLRFAAAIAATTLLYSTPVPAPAASVPPSFTIAPSAAEEDSGRLCFPVRMHGTRSSLPSSVKVSLIAGTARPIEDYVAATRELRFEPSEFGTSKVVCFDLVNDARPELTETVTGKLAKGLNSRLYRGAALGTITDTDRAAPPAPEPVPDPAPEPTPVPGGTAWVAEALVTAPNARALKSCSSIYRTAETDRVGIAFRGVTAGAVYALNPWGRATSWGDHPFKNIAGQQGTVWTVALPGGGHATVAQACLEGVRPAG